MRSAAHRYYAHGCFCWQVYNANKLLVLDARRMEFSAVNLPSPPGRYGQQMAIVEAGEGRLGMLTICDKIQSDAYHLFYAQPWTIWSHAITPLPIFLGAYGRNTIKLYLHHAYDLPRSHVPSTASQTPPLSPLSQIQPPLPFHLLFHNRPPSRSEGLRPDQPPPHHGVRRGVPGSLAVTQCGADLVVRPHQAFDALTAPSTRYRDERAVFCLLRLPRTTDATSSHRLAQHQHRPLLTGVQNCCYVMDLVAHGSITFALGLVFSR
ncbi:uncharacterized protein LOC119332966 [Triticum dicoccoides]|uniref:uncharacterized protein LOC119332966 n=1 Tax=Triticum dicoccoides TaxID=85692 RepID=UPI0018915456|nr:uncharacterized protein LOC119332966 [Triticum dicoccoides]